MSAQIEQIPGEQGKVGYGRPPAHTRFKKGASGNPSGRRKGTYSVSEAYQRFLAMTPEKRAAYKAKNGAEEIALARFKDAASEADLLRIQATKEITDRTEGKARETKDISSVVKIQVVYDEPGREDDSSEAPTLTLRPEADSLDLEEIQCFSVRA